MIAKTKEHQNKIINRAVLLGLVSDKFENDSSFQNELLKALNVFYPSVYLADDALQEIDTLTYKTILGGEVRKQIKALAVNCDRLKKAITKDSLMAINPQSDDEVIDDVFNIKKLLSAIGGLSSEDFDKVLEFANSLKKQNK